MFKNSPNSKQARRVAAAAPSNDVPTGGVEVALLPEELQGKNMNYYFYLNTFIINKGVEVALLPEEIQGIYIYILN